MEVAVLVNKICVLNKLGYFPYLKENKFSLANQWMQFWDGKHPKYLLVSGGREEGRICHILELFQNLL
jgi:hypothetical protein